MLSGHASPPPQFLRAGYGSKRFLNPVDRICPIVGQIGTGSVHFRAARVAAPVDDRACDTGLAPNRMDADPEARRDPVRVSLL